MKKVQAARLAQQLTTWELAKKSGVGPSTIMRAERRGVVKLRALFAIARALDLSPTKLIDEEAVQ